jgi:hypothetical protein
VGVEKVRYSNEQIGQFGAKFAPYTLRVGLGTYCNTLFHLPDSELDMVGGTSLR